jgi:hypothetical protein
MEPFLRTSVPVGEGSPSFNLPYRSGNDTPPSLPFPPLNVHITSPFFIGVLDVRWDNPASIPYNSGLSVLGVNIYRAFDSPNGTYTKLNPTPMSSRTYRDATQEVLVTQEDVMATMNPGNNPEQRWYFHTAHKPLLITGSNGEGASSVSTVLVEIDDGKGAGFVPVVASRVVAEEGLVYLNTGRTYDPFKNAYVPAVLPDMLSGGIRVTYRYLNGLIATDYYRKLYYKVTTVALDSAGNTIETPMREVEAQTPYQMEKTDFIWKEAIRKNAWLLDREGERVKLYIRKWNGVRCKCYDSDYGYSKRIGIPGGGCPICFGTGYEGGYEGPYDLKIAPPETEKTVNLLDAGFHVTYDWATWTGPEPLLGDRDVIIRANNDRYFVNRPNPQGSRGAIYQQHFSLAHIDQKDPVYLLRPDGGSLGVPASWNAYREARPTDASPEIPVKGTVPEGILRTGRTVTFENISA